MRSLAAWLEVSGIPAGSIFRSITRHQAIGGRLTAKAVALIVKRSAITVGIDSTTLLGHTLRSGSGSIALDGTIRLV